jgi:hypothetical protein
VAKHPGQGSRRYSRPQFYVSASDRDLSHAGDLLRVTFADRSRRCDGGRSVVAYQMFPVRHAPPALPVQLLLHSSAVLRDRVLLQALPLRRPLHGGPNRLPRGGAEWYHSRCFRCGRCQVQIGGNRLCSCCGPRSPTTPRGSSLVAASGTSTNCARAARRGWAA